jgi:hypothetical protein
VLPTLNNFLENRELSLDDSFMLLSADAFKRHYASNLNIRRVHPSFRKTCENHQLQVSITHVFSSPWSLCQNTPRLVILWWPVSPNSSRCQRGHTFNIFNISCILRQSGLSLSSCVALSWTVPTLLIGDFSKKKETFAA